MKKLLRNRKGSILINSVVLMVVLLLTGAAFLKWTADEAYQARFDLARTQAYYIAQHGALQRGLSSLRAMDDISLPRVQQFFAPGNPREYGEMYGYYESCSIDPVDQIFNSEVENLSPDEYEISAVGVVEFVQPNGEVQEVKRQFNMVVQKPALSKYFYFSDSEVTEFGEVIWFYQEDVLYGPVRSNDAIGIKNTPTFYSDVISVADDFIHGSGFNPEFLGPEPVFEADSVKLDDRASQLRDAAAAVGNYYDDNNGEWQTRIVAEQSGWHVMQWGAGTPFPEDGQLDTDEYIPYSNNSALFCEGPLQLWGDRVQGRGTVGAEGDIRLMDDIRYADYGPRDLTPDNQADSYYLADRGSSNVLGIISESRIRIANSIENGKGNGATSGSELDHSDKHIIITAALIALGLPNGCFDFENQNNAPDDPFGWDGYWWCDPEGSHPNQPDERGEIWLRGSVIQRQRGYVHRSNCGGTGYDKEYAYDIRMWKTPPPYFPKETNDDGFYDFQITTTWDQNPDRREDFQ